MIINLYNTEIILAKYGTVDKNIDVTNKVKTTNEFIVSNDFFGIDPCFGVVKKLFITLKNNKKYIIWENEKCIFINNKNYTLAIENKVKQVIQNNKYNYILSTNVRDEKNILEFILYHLMIGFDRIYIIDHLSKIPIDIEIKKLPDEYKNKVEVYRFTKEGSHKMYFLNKIIIPYMEQNCSKYFIHLDGDEYINLNNKFNNIDELMKHYNYPDILCLNWLLFGSNNKDINDNKYNCLIPTYTKCLETIENHFKIIVSNKLNDIRYINPHMIYYNNNNSIYYTDISNNKHLLVNSKKESIFNLFKLTYINKNIKEINSFINHYTIQSKEDYMKRKVHRNRDDINNNRKFDDNILQMYNDIEYNNLIPYYNKIKQILFIKPKLGFIILRHVNSDITNKYWQQCYDCIRKFYNNPIIIIDDQSDNKYLTTDKELINTTIINSEYKGRGELLPYYYYLKNYFCERLVVLHDSMFINKYIEFENIKGYNNFTRLFSFPNTAYKQDIEYFKDYCKNINNGETILNYHNKNINKLIGCFGVCYIIDYHFLFHIENKYKISNLRKIIDTRNKRKTLERFFSCLFQYEIRKIKQNTIDNLNGCIFTTIKNIKNNKPVKITKLFTGR